MSTSSASASTTPPTDASSTSPIQPAQAQAPAQSQAQSQPSSDKPTFKLVHVVGTKYIDYFTDGSKTYSFPGNPDINSNLNKPNAPIPTHGNLTWVSTSGMEAYDTPSGDLESSDYAQEADGSYISNVPAYTYTDATSSVPIAAHIATSKSDPTSATVTASAPADTTQSATTPTTSTTTPVTSRVRSRIVRRFFLGHKHGDFHPIKPSTRRRETDIELPPSLRRAIPARRLSAISTRSLILHVQASQPGGPKNRKTHSNHQPTGVFCATIPCYVRRCAQMPLPGDYANNNFVSSRATELQTLSAIFFQVLLPGYFPYPLAPSLITALMM